MVKKLMIRAIWNGEWKVAEGRHVYIGQAVKMSVFKIVQGITIDVLEHEVSVRMDTDHPPTKKVVLRYHFQFPDANLYPPNTLTKDIEIKDIFDITEKGSTVSMYVTLEDLVDQSGIDVDFADQDSVNQTETLNNQLVPLSTLRSYRDDYFPDLEIVAEDHDDDIVDVGAHNEIDHNPTVDLAAQDMVDPRTSMEHNNFALATVPVECSGSRGNSGKGRLDDLEIQKGGLYTANELTLHIRKVAGAKKWTFYVHKRDQTRIILRCLEKECKWKVGAYKRKDSVNYQVKKHDPIHTCTASTVDGKHRNITSAVVANELLGQMGESKKTPTIFQVQEVAKKLGTELSYWAAWSARQKAKSMIQGTRAQNYADLPAFMYLCEALNPGTVWDIGVDQDGVFMYSFLAFGAQIVGIPYMRPLIVIDMAHMKKEPLQLVVCTMVDSQKHCYPIAWGLVEKENIQAWTWFLTKLTTIRPDQNGLTFVSDRHQAIINSIKTVYPLSNHVHCYHHLKMNAMAHYSSTKWATHFWHAAYTFDKVACETHLTDMGVECDHVNSVNKMTVEGYLRDAGLEKWARSHCKTARFEQLTSNHAESINSCLLAARSDRPLTMFTQIADQQCAWLLAKRIKGIEMGDTHLTAKREKRMLKRAQKCIGFYVRPITQYEYEVRGNDLKTHLVNFQPGHCLGTCTCGEYQQMWFPCVHAAACASELKKLGHYKVKHDFEVMYDHTSAFYSLEYYTKAYAGTIHTPPNPAAWDITQIPLHIRNFRPLPPKKVVKVGRDKEKRHKPIVETVREKKRGTGTYGCSHCHVKGHTKKSCPHLRH